MGIMISLQVSGLLQGSNDIMYENTLEFKVLCVCVYIYIYSYSIYIYIYIVIMCVYRRP